MKEKERKRRKGKQERKKEGRKRKGGENKEREFRKKGKEKRIRVPQRRLERPTAYRLKAALQPSQLSILMT